MRVRRDENYRESWYVRNLTNNKINIGDLPLVPTLNPGQRIDILRFYDREKISHSIVLTQLVKANVVSLNKQKIYNNGLPGNITSAEVDEAITPAEENELGAIGGDGHTHDNLDILDGFSIDSAGNLIWEGAPIEGGGTWIHNDLLGLQGGDVALDEFYHLDYLEFLYLTGGPDYNADHLHVHSGITQLDGGYACTVYGGVIGTADGGDACFTTSPSA